MSESESATPRLVFDDDCGFCTWCAEYAAERGEFELVGFRDLTPDQLARLPDEYEDCAHLLTQDAVYSCGEAIEEVGTRLETPSRHLAAAFRQLPGAEEAREPLYRRVADNRDLFGKIVRRDPPAREN
ncbi:thiol-disulfide oxidoreductase DCC family protein [Halostagnicola bangensis]